ncbi:DUF1758 domain-containing protein [Trichonephila clavata]|uniref:DUF1758 domain-containing protein n=1 Tax=Trichonephila clavata TaxID=2740835 RepID=A0A8X6J229_TRICU|nr:DUF1758 domain-containing protein [Trichonephila clavata]
MRSGKESQINKGREVFLCCYTCCHVEKCKKEVCSCCKGRHARAICFKLENSLKQNSHIDLEKGKVDVKPTSSNSVLHNRGGVLLQCVKAEVIGHIFSDKIFCLFDNGSEKSFIKKNVSRRLGLKKVGSEKLNIFSFGCKTPKKQTCIKVEVRLRNILNGEVTVIEALEIEEISKATLSLPSPDVWTEMETKGFRLAFNCSESSENCEISLLIGSDFYWPLTHRIKRLDSSLVVVETSLGWSLQGKCDEQSDCTSVHLIHSEEETISAELRRFWEIESLGIRDNNSVSLGNGDEEILSEFDKSVCFVDGRYRVSLPWKPGMREVLQNNKTVARKRFEGKYKEQYPHTFDLLNSSIYVDDFICGRNDVPDALRTTLECLQIFSDASMLLRKWRTNSKQLDLLWQQEGVETEFSETSATDLKPPIKVLGLAWDSEKDLIYFDPKDLLKFMSPKTESKRFILSVVGSHLRPHWNSWPIR